MQKIGHAWALALALLAVTSCGSQSGSTSSSDKSTAVLAVPPSGRTVHVAMRALWFYPDTLYARVGQRVVWTNDDSSPHNVTYVSGPMFKSSRPVLPPGAKFTLDLNKPGTIHYYCSIHPWMKATIVVSP